MRIKKESLTGYMFGSAFFKPEVNTFWARSNVDTLVCIDEQYALGACRDSTIWTCVYMVSAKNIELATNNVVAGRFLLVRQPTKLLIQELIYDKDVIKQR